MMKKSFRNIPMSYSNKVYSINCNIFLILKNLDILIVTAGEILDSIMVRNDIPIHDMPLVQQTMLHTSKVEDVVKHWEQSSIKPIKAAHTEVQDVLSTYFIPSL